MYDHPSDPPNMRVIASLHKNRLRKNHMAHDFNELLAKSNAHDVSARDQSIGIQEQIDSVDSGITNISQYDKILINLVDGTKNPEQDRYRSAIDEQDQHISNLCRWVEQDCHYCEYKLKEIKKYLEYFPHTEFIKKVMQQENEFNLLKTQCSNALKKGKEQVARKLHDCVIDQQSSRSLYRPKVQNNQQTMQNPVSKNRTIKSPD